MYFFLFLQILLISYIFNAETATRNRIDLKNQSNSTSRKESSNENITKVSFEDEDNISNLEEPTALPFLLSWLTLDNDIPTEHVEPRKNNRKIFYSNEQIPRPFLPIKEPHSSTFSNSLNRNIHSSETYRKYPQRVNSIQDVIKYLESQEESSSQPYLENEYKRIKFKGIYHHNKPNIYTSSNKSHKRVPSHYHLKDPFYRYKPQNPGDINLLAPNSYRFSPTVVPVEPQSSDEYPIYEPINPMYVPKSSIKPVSLMLDIYPITNEGLENNVGSFSTQLPVLQSTVNYKSSPSNDNFKTADYENGSGDSETTNIPFGTKIVSKTNNNNSMKRKENQQRNKMVIQLNVYPSTMPQAYNPYIFKSKAISSTQNIPIPMKHNNMPIYDKINGNYYNSKELLQNEIYVAPNNNYQILRPVYNRREDQKSRMNTDIISSFNPNFISFQQNSTFIYNPENQLESLRKYKRREDSLEEENDIHIEPIRKFENLTEIKDMNNTETVDQMDNIKKNKNNDKISHVLHSYEFPETPQVIHNKYLISSEESNTKWDLNQLQNNPSLFNNTI